MSKGTYGRKTVSRSNELHLLMGSILVCIAVTVLLAGCQLPWMTAPEVATGANPWTGLLHQPVPEAASNFRPSLESSGTGIISRSEEAP